MQDINNLSILQFNQFVKSELLLLSEVVLAEFSTVEHISTIPATYSVII